jgi:hypothetical protein
MLRSRAGVSPAALPPLLSKARTGAKTASVLKSLHVSLLVLEICIAMADNVPACATLQTGAG